MIIERGMAAVGYHIRRHWMAWMLGSLLLFLLFPAVDLTVSGWFWTAQDGWFLARTPLAEFVRKGFPPILFGCLIFIVVLWTAGKLMGQRFLPLRGRAVIYLLASLAIGPGLIANTLLKDNWGRARPSQIVEFGGTALYTPPFMVSNACAENCSFVSGHGSLGFWLTAFAFLVPLAWRGRAMAAALTLGAAVGAVRIIQGGHFLSDVVYAAVLVVALNWFLSRILLEHDPAPTIEPS